MKGQDRGISLNILPIIKKFKSLDNINDQFCRSNPQNEQNNEKNFLDILTAKSDRNDTNLNNYCQQQTVSKRINSF